MTDYTDLRTELSRNEYVDTTDYMAAEMLNTISGTVVMSRFITARTILFELGGTAGAVVLDKLEAAATQISAVKWAMRFLLGETGIDIGAAETRNQLDMLAGAGILTADECVALKNMALQPVSRAMQLMGRAVDHTDIAAARRG